MNTEQKDENLEARLDALEDLLFSINQKLNTAITQNENIGGWLKEKDIIRITGLKKSSLYTLRRKNKITSSSIAERGVFYRLSDFEKLLNKNELKR
jgi:hypothetical protein